MSADRKNGKARKAVAILAVVLVAGGVTVFVITGNGEDSGSGSKTVKNTRKGTNSKAGKQAHAKEDQGQAKDVNVDANATYTEEYKVEADVNAPETQKPSQQTVDAPEAEEPSQPQVDAPQAQTPQVQQPQIQTPSAPQP